ncbi:MAG: hypothetical protein ABEJ95_02055 [Candidatus Nanohalobium sp.]
MEFEYLNSLEGLQEDIFYLGVIAVIVVFTGAFHNLITPDSSVRVGYVEVETECTGIDAGICLGIQRQDHTTYNYDNYTEVEEGTENFYRRVEAELMAQAYNICNTDMSGMEWTDQAEYRNQTGTEWLENKNVELLPCERTFYRSINATE